MLVAEITAAIDSSGTLQTFYVSDGRFTTSPSDTPANTSFDESIIEPGSIGIHAFTDGRTGGVSKLETGDLILANSDGQYDSWINYSFDARNITIRQGQSSGAYPSSFTTIFTGTIQSVEADWDKIIIKLKDKQFIFSVPFLKTKYAGTNSLPNGLEGTANDIKGKVKPKIYGKVFQISPPCVNTSKLTYQVNDGAVNSIDAVYDRGLALTPGTNHANSAALQAATPGAGTYDTCIAEGYFRLGSSPAGKITADVTQGSSAANRTVAQIVKLLALDSGLSSGEISSSDVTALDTANSSVVGIYIDDESNYQENIDKLLNSIGAYCSFDGTGTLRLGVLTNPSGTPVATLYEYEILGIPERTVPKDNGIPAYRVTLNHTKLFTTQATDLAGAVTDATRAYLAKEYRTVISEDTSIKTQWLLATEYFTNTLLTSSSDASTEAARQLALYKVRRDIYEVAIPLDSFSSYGLKVMDLVSMTVPRFGMNSGKLFRVLGFRLELKNDKVYLSLWG